MQAISRNDAGAKNLQVTSGAVEEIIERSRAQREKAIVFVTGVPGAGKTLVGLTSRRDDATLARPEPCSCLAMDHSSPCCRRR